MSEYYFLASLLPTLEIGHIPSLGFSELKELLPINLTVEDLEKTHQLRRQIDIENLQALWTDQPLDPRANLNRSELEKALADFMWNDQEPFEDYLVDFLMLHTSKESRLINFSQLLASFFSYEAPIRKGFLQDYFAFQKQWRLVMIGFRARVMGKDIFQELQFEDSGDPIVAEILAQKDAKSYEPPFEYKELKPIFDQYQEDPLNLHKALYAYQFNYMVERWGGALFSIDRILNYMTRLILVERWLELDLQKGIHVIDEIERKIS